MTKFTTAACLVAALATTSFGAFAAAQRAGGERIAALDIDGDSFISRSEAAANPKLAGNFDAIDTNHDGKLSPAEMKSYAKLHKAEKGNKAISKLDTNGDGMVSREEAASSKKLSANFDMVDTNRDGRLSASEMKAARASMKSNAAPMPPANSGAPQTPPPAPAPAT